MSLSIFDLPPELLEEIFSPKYFPKANDRRRLALVSKTFYKIIRRQSKKFSTLYVNDEDPDKSPVQVFKDSTTFPFSKLCFGYDAPENVQDQDFWLEHGQHITELTIVDRFFFNRLIFFPCLKKLKFNRFSELLIDENPPKIQLPVEELCIKADMNGICHILQCCPSLKSVEFSIFGNDSYADVLPWIESIETVKMNMILVELKEMCDLPSKVLFRQVFISSNTNVENIASFFNKPRLIESLCLMLHPDANEINSQWTKDKILPLLKAESIETLALSGFTGCAPEFPEILDLLARVPGLQEIKIYFGSDLGQIRLFPLQWSSLNTASKIHEVGFRSRFYPEDLSGLNSLSCLTIGSSDGSLEVLRNHPKLKKLVIESFSDVDAELEPISSLHDLEILELWKAPNITSAAFKTIIKFPKLKKLLIRSEKMENDVATLLPENCPNLEELNLGYVQYSLGLERLFSDDMKQKHSLNDAEFEHLIRSLPYLKEICIHGYFHSVSQEKVQQMQMDFPYLTIYVENSLKTIGLARLRFLILFEQLHH